jgi:hypothetical protein
MSRVLSTAALGEMTGAESSDALIELLEVSHPTFVNTIYLTSNSTPVVSNEITYQPMFYILQMPEDNGKVVVSASITIDNIDRTVLDNLRRLPSAPHFNARLVLESNPDYAEYLLLGMRLQDIVYNELSLTARIVYDDILNQKAIPGVVDDKQYPGLK